MKNNIKGFKNTTLGILKLPSVAFFLFQNVRRQKIFIQNHLLPDLKYFEEKNDGSLKMANFKKITNYYALGVPAILGYGFGILRNHPLNEKERICISYLGGISGLLDDLFDEPDKDVLHLETFILFPEKLKPKNNYEALLKHCYIKGLAVSENPQALKLQAQQVFHTEAESELQRKNELSVEKIKELTFRKGGHSFLFYRLCLQNILNDAERKLIFQLGGLMQMGNDIFDLWEDLQEGIETLATKTTSIQQLRNSFSSELEITLSLLSKCDYPKKQLQAFARIILFGLSRVFVCLDQFENLQESESSIFEPEKYSRKQLICDMELLKNRKAAIKYYLKLHSQYL